MKQELLERAGIAENALAGLNPELNRVGTEPVTENVFKDEVGRLTFYVKNTGQYPLLITSLGIKIEPNTARDLLEVETYEKLSENKDLKSALNTIGSKLTRISKDEYIRFVQRYTDGLNKRAQQLADFESRLAPLKEAKDVDIRNIVKSQVSKVVNFYTASANTIKDNVMTPFDFCNWAEVFNFTLVEADYVLGMVNDADIKKLMLGIKHKLI